MKRILRRKEQRPGARSILRLPDLEVAKSAVLNTLSCPDAQRGYRHAIDEFVDWYCSEARLSFSKTVVVRYRLAAGIRRVEGVKTARREAWQLVDRRSRGGALA